ASLMALPSVISRTPWPLCWLIVVLGIDILCHLAGIWIGGVERELLARGNFGLYTLLDLRECLRAGSTLLNQPAPEDLQRIAIGLPGFFFFFGTVVGARHIANVVPVVAIGVTEQERRTFALARALHQALGRGLDRAHVLAIDRLAVHTKGFGPAE